MTQEIKVARKDLAKRLAIRARRLADDMTRKYHRSPDYADYEEVFMEELESMQETSVRIVEDKND